MKFVPHDYQVEGGNFLLDTPRGLLWMPMGGGKTSAVLTALDALDLVDTVYPALVIAPLAVARNTWPDEVEKWDHLSHLNIQPVLGTQRERERALGVEADIYTTNYDNLVWLQEAFRDKWPFETIVSDEVTRLRSYRTRQGGKRARALGKVAHNSSRFWGLTGTPTPKGLQDLWGQMWFVDEGDRLGYTYGAFEHKWFYQVKKETGEGRQYKQIKPHEDAFEGIMGLIADVTLTVKGLPVDKPLLNDIYIELPAKARRLYDELEREMFVAMTQGDVTAVHAAALSTKCRQVAAGAIYLDREDGAKKSEWEVIHDAKLDALESVFEEANGMPVLVAYDFISDRARLAKRFPRGKVFDGSREMLRDWNAGKIPYLFTHPESAGHGLNMADGGNILVFFNVGWKTENYLQIIERIGPQRQKQAGYDRPMHLHRIIARDTVEEGVIARLEGRMSVQEAVLARARRGHPQHTQAS